MDSPYGTGLLETGDRRGVDYFRATRRKGDKHRPLPLSASCDIAKSYSGPPFTNEVSPWIGITVT